MMQRLEMKQNFTKEVPNFNTLHLNNSSKIMYDYFLSSIKKYNLSY